MRASQYGNVDALRTLIEARAEVAVPRAPPSTHLPLHTSLAPLLPPASATLVLITTVGMSRVTII